MPGTPIVFPAGAGETDFLYVDANVGLTIPAQDEDWLWIDANAGLAIPPQDEDWLYIDGNLAYGTGTVHYPWRESDDGSNSPTARY